METSVKVACAQLEPVILERDATIEKMASTCAEAAAEGAKLVVFPESFVSVYPSSRWARYMAEWEKSDEAKTVFARLMRESVELPSEAADRIGAVARENGVWLAVGVNERDRGTIYNALLVYAPDGTLALHHRKLMPTNHERMVWGLGTGKGLTAIPTPIGKIGGLICWENFMPLARFALYDAGVEIYLAPTADDTETWHETIRHIARESRAFVVSPSVFQRASSYPDIVPIADGPDVLGRGGSAVVGPDGNYLAGPLWDEEGILYAELDPDLLYAERQRFDPAGHYSRPDVFTFEVR
jgi:nitrilase